MTRARLAYMPLITYPDIAPDDSVAAAIAVAAALGLELHAKTFSVEIPRGSSALGGVLLDLPEMIRTTEENSVVQCRRLEDLVRQQAGTAVKAECTTRKLAAGLTLDAAAIQARYYDLSLLPWAKDKLTIQDLAQAVVFGSGRPAILVPPSAIPEKINHVAIAWDGTRVAARALADAMPLLTDDARLTVLTIQDEKQLERGDIASALASSLQLRGLDAQAKSVPLDGRPIAEALQASAAEAGADLLVMGGFGHSRIRDFILGGATKGVFRDLRMPVLLSH